MNLLDLKIETERLLLVPVSLEYAQDMFQEFTVEITRFMFPKPPENITGAEVFINDSLKKMAIGKDIVCMVLQKDTKEYLGNAGLHHVDTANPELGIWIKKSAHGNKYGREAMEALKHWADEQLDYEYISYPVDKKNIASRKIPESMGGVIGREYKLTGMGGQELDEVEYRIYRNDKFMSITYREFEEKDFGQILELMDDFHDYLSELDPLKHLKRLEGYGEKKVLEMKQKIVDTNGKIFIANENSKIIGFIAGYVEETSQVDRMENIVQKYGHVIELFILQEYRGKNVGRDLMQKIEKYFFEQKCEAVLIEVFEPNTGAHNFYKNCGYQDRSIELIKELK